MIETMARAMWQWARERERKISSSPIFAIPPGIATGSADDLVIRSEDGWILDCPE